MENTLILNDIYIFILLLLAIITVILFRYTINLRNYLKEFMVVSKNISNKNFESRITTSMNGEMGEFAKNFNYMIDTINTTIDDITNKNIQLKSIMQSVSHGMLAIDNAGKIFLINDLGKIMVNGDNRMIPEGKNIKNFIKNGPVLEAILKNMSKEASTVFKINISENIIYKIKIDPVYFQETDVVIGFIINIEDVTEYVKLENMRKDFVANVSHELKTPLTSIKGFVETLRITDNLDTNTKNRFLDIIDHETTRLTRLIEDILLLSTVENKTKKNLEQINLFEVFEDIFNITNHLSKKKDIKIDYNFKNIDIKLWQYPGYISQIFLNIIENAVKYTPNGGKIEVNQYIDYNYVVVEISDNGIGIPKEDLNRIFERFYRVDKARSRNIGGTGLGLAITKHMVKSLNGNIRVESKLGKGSKFTIEFPLNNEINEK